MKKMLATTFVVLGLAVSVVPLAESCLLPPPPPTTCSCGVAPVDA